MDSSDEQTPIETAENINDNKSAQDSEIVSAEVTEEPTKPEKRISRRYLYAILALIIIFSTCFYWFYIKKTTSVNKNKSNTQESSANDANSQNQYIQTVGNIPKILFNSNQTNYGISVGYVHSNQSVSSSNRGNWLVGSASATESEYDPVVFYTLNGNIYSLNIATKQSSTITSNGGKNPVFSSPGQLLAYNSSEGCSVSYINLQNNQDTSIVKGQSIEQQEINNEITNENVCFVPSAWSPDGKKLALRGIYYVNSSELGLVSFENIYIYTIETKAITKLDNPDNYNTTTSSVYWIDNENILVRHADRGAYANESKHQISKLNITSSDSEPLVLKNSEADFDVDSIRIYGDNFYSLGDNRSSMYYGLTSDINNLNVREGFNYITTYLVNAEHSEEIYYINSDVGTDGASVLNRFNLNTLQGAEVYKTEGFASYLIGWGKNFDNIIYMAQPSGKSVMHQYTISTNTDEVLVDNLPLVQ